MNDLNSLLGTRACTGHQGILYQTWQVNAWCESGSDTELEKQSYETFLYNLQLQ